jgi:FKBP-type peptidyl-prolyl cis-trans isomerase (trigger factor)
VHERLAHLKEHIENNRLDMIRSVVEAFSAEEAIRTIAKINEGWYPKGIKRNEIFYLRTLVLKRLSQHHIQQEDDPNLSTWDNIIRRWDQEQLLNDIYETENVRQQS